MELWKCPRSKLNFSFINEAPDIWDWTVPALLPVMVNHRSLTDLNTHRKQAQLTTINPFLFIMALKSHYQQGSHSLGTAPSEKGQLLPPKHPSGQICQNVLHLCRSKMCKTNLIITEVCFKVFMHSGILFMDYCLMQRKLVDNLRLIPLNPFVILPER